MVSSIRVSLWAQESVLGCAGFPPSRLCTAVIFWKGCEESGAGTVVWAGRWPGSGSQVLLNDRYPSLPPGQHQGLLGCTQDPRGLPAGREDVEISSHGFFIDGGAD